MKNKILKNIEKWCKEYVVCLIIYTVIFTVGGYVKDSPEMKGAASVSLMLVAWMVAIINWKQIKVMMKRRPDEEVKKYFDEHGSYINRRAQRLYEEVKNKYADNGIMLYDDIIHKIRLDVVNELHITTLGLLDLEMMLEAVEEDADSIKKQLEDKQYALGLKPSDFKSFVVEYMFQDEFDTYRTRDVIFYGRLMTEEEIMMRKALKEMGIEQ